LADDLFTKTEAAVTDRPDVGFIIARERAADFPPGNDPDSSIGQGKRHGGHDGRVGAQGQARCRGVIEHGQAEEVQPDAAAPLRRVQVDQQGHAFAALKCLEQFGHGESLQDGAVACVTAQAAEDAFQMRIARLLGDHRQREPQPSHRQSEQFPLAVMECNKDNPFAPITNLADVPQAFRVHLHPLFQRHTIQLLRPKQSKKTAREVLERRQCNAFLFLD